MSLSHYDPLASLRAVETAFSRLLTEPQSNRPWAPSVDIYETENELVVKADLPDVDPNAIDVRVENQTLTIAATATSSAASPCPTPSIPTRLMRATRTACSPSP
jgi:HSP20 family molecular chaperone IbpA